MIPPPPQIWIKIQQSVNVTKCTYFKAHNKWNIEHSYFVFIIWFSLWIWFNQNVALGLIKLYTFIKGEITYSDSMELSPSPLVTTPDSIISRRVLNSLFFFCRSTMTEFKNSTWPRAASLSSVTLEVAWLPATKELRFKNILEIIHSWRISYIEMHILQWMSCQEELLKWKTWNVHTYLKFKESQMNWILKKS